MADHHQVGEIYVYRGGRAPQHITHAIIDKSVTSIDDHAFEDNTFLHTVETHAGLKEIRSRAFHGCESLTHLDIRSVRILGSASFASSGLTEIDCDNLEFIEDNTFTGCKSLRQISFPKVKRIDGCAFEETSLTELVFPKVVEFVDGNAFCNSAHLRRICLPLKVDLFLSDFDPGSFDGCESLATVELIGGIHETVSSLHMKAWKDDMSGEINRINTILSSNPSFQKTTVMRWWLQTVHCRIEHYKTEHKKVLKEATVLLELALWKGNINHDESGGGDESLEAPTKKVKLDVRRARNELRITSGANIVIKNVLPFLELK